MPGGREQTSDQQARVQKRLAALAERRERLRTEQVRVRSELRRLIPEARASGWGVTHLARVTGMTRRAVYDLLELEGDHQGGIAVPAPSAPPNRSIDRRIWETLWEFEGTYHHTASVTDVAEALREDERRIAERLSVLAADAAVPIYRAEVDGSDRFRAVKTSSEIEDEL
jgi:uncharacterized protein (UPF0335 family)